MVSAMCVPCPQCAWCGAAVAPTESSGNVSQIARELEPFSRHHRRCTKTPALGLARLGSRIWRSRWTAAGACQTYLPVAVPDSLASSPRQQPKHHRAIGHQVGRDARQAQAFAVDGGHVLWRVGHAYQQFNARRAQRHRPPAAVHLGHQIREPNRASPSAGVLVHRR